MSSTLGLYIEDNLIKYAKVSKSNDNVKVEAFGIKFYDKLEETLKQIVEETYSYKIPISVNLAEEQYNYYDVFGMLAIIRVLKKILLNKDFYVQAHQKQKKN